METIVNPIPLHRNDTDSGQPCPPPFLFFVSIPPPPLMISNGIAMSMKATSEQKPVYALLFWTLLKAS